MFVSYCQYYLQGDDFLTVYDDAYTVGRIFEGNSLAAGGPEHFTVFTGTHTGWIRLTTEQCEEEPPSPGLEWETAVDVSIYSTSGNLRLFRWGGDVEEEAGNFATSARAGIASGFKLADEMRVRGMRATTRWRSGASTCRFSNRPIAGSSSPTASA